MNYPKKNLVTLIYFHVCAQNKKKLIIMIHYFEKNLN